MTLADGLTWAGGIAASLITAAVGWLYKVAFDNRELGRELGVRVNALETRMLNKEDVRVVVDQALERYRQDHAERRKEWDRALTAEIRSAIVESASAQRAITAEQIERLVPRVVREVCDACPGRRQHNGSDSGDI
jgi:Fe2+ transport system protein B